MDPRVLERSACHDHALRTANEGLRILKCLVEAMRARLLELLWRHVLQVLKSGLVLLFQIVHLNVLLLHDFGQLQLVVNIFCLEVFHV